MKKLLKITAAVTIFFIALFAGSYPAEAASGPMVRVKLSVSSTSVSIKVGGAYHIDGGADIPTGSYKVSVSGSKVRIKGGSVDKTVNSPLKLVRDEKSVNTKNISVSGTKYGTVNYLGDMSFYVSSGKIMTVNTLPVEHYLYGVVANEMSNSFPLEALKAQAVCARGYVVKTLSSSGTYDIGDTSSDQVYRGYNSSYGNVIKAVDETKDQVLMYDNKTATTYFSASNGGQTELPGNAWGGGSSKNKTYPYLAQRDDPYDLENTSSLEQTIFVPSDVKNSKEAAKESSGIFAYSNSVLSDLQVQAKAALSKKGVTVSDSKNIEIVAVNSLKNGKERWEGTGSRSYVTAKAEITVQYYAKGSSKKSDAVKLTVTLQLMKSSGGSYVLAHDYLNPNLRLRGIESAKGGYNVIARRYGHGVGMSQRGAQTMAKQYKKTYKEILAFYVKGTKLSNAPDTPDSDSSSAAVMYGDVDMDGKISMTDLLLVHKGLLNLKKLSDAQRTAADVNRDGSVTMSDLLGIHKHLLNIQKISE